MKIIDFSSIKNKKEEVVLFVLFCFDFAESDISNLFLKNSVINVKD